MELLKTDTIEEARERLLKYEDEISPDTEICALTEADGRVAAAYAACMEDIPPYRRSTMDGYSVRSSDLGAAGDMAPTILRIAGEIVLGNDPGGISVIPGSCAYVPTGGYVPEGADAVVMAEYCEPFGDGMLAVSKSAAPGENVVQAGEDMKKGQAVLKPGRRIRPQDIGVLAAAGITEVPVFVPWKVTVISTGDELVGAEEEPGPGQMRDVNTYAIAARCREEGFEVVRTVRVRDDRDAIRAAFEEAKADSDLIAISGGSSKGAKDMTAELIDEAADCGVLTHGIAAKPGKPTITGFDRKSGTLFAGLPGHPAAALMVFEQLVIGLWRELTDQNEEICVRARITSNIGSAAGRRTFQPVRLHEDGDELTAEPVIAKSGMIYPLSTADGYFEMSENQEGIREGDIVYVHLWR